jgi:hypothetical protein
LDCKYDDLDLTDVEKRRAFDWNPITQTTTCAKKRDDARGMQREYASLEIMYQGLDTVYRRTPFQRLAPALAASPPAARPRRPADAETSCADCPTSVMTSTPATLSSPFFKCCTCVSLRGRKRLRAFSCATRQRVRPNQDQLSLLNPRSEMRAIEKLSNANAFAGLCCMFAISATFFLFYPVAHLTKRGKEGGCLESICGVVDEA